MSPDSLFRVACLRIPRFLTAVLERSGQVRRGTRCVLVRGTGGYARVAAQSLAAYRSGVRVGMLLSRAVMVVADLQVIPVDESPAQQVTEHLLKRLHSVTPRISSMEAGSFWLEPFSSTDDGESHFVAQVFALLREEGFDDPRVGIADTVVASNAASRLVGPYGWRSVETGGDASFLAELSLDFLPIGIHLKSLLRGVGVRTIQELQLFSSDGIQRRLGRAGLRAWTLAWAKDPRGPRTPACKAARRIDVHLLEPTRSVETLLFILNGVVERLSSGLRAEHRAAACMQLSLVGEAGEELCLHIKIASATFDAALLFELVKNRLIEGEHSAWTDSDVESVTLAVIEEVPFTLKQSDLWSSVSLAPHLRARVTMDVEKVLGGTSFVTPILNDSQKPELRGRWVRRGDSENTQFPVHTISPSDPLPSCMKMLESPKPLHVRGEGFLPSEIFVSELSELGWIRIFHWSGPETLSGCWWDAPYERDYYWAITEDQCAVWVFVDRLHLRWFVHGWLD